MLSAAEAIELARDTLLPMHNQELQRLDLIDLWASHKQERPQVPAKATSEHRALADLARTPWLSLVVTTVAQAMFADGYRSPNGESATRSWETWQANSLDHRQIALHRAALTYGYCYETILPGTGRAVMRGVSPRRMQAVYERPESDDWPVYALETTGAVRRLFDDEAIYVLDWTDQPKVVKVIPHGIGVCPVVRFTNQIDLEGRTLGEVEPFIDLAKRTNKTAYDRLLTQHFNSWKVRWVTGMDIGGEDEDPDEVRTRLSQSDMLVGKDPTTRFGTMEETQLQGFITAFENDLETLASVSQTPAYHLTGKLINLSAEALAAARAPLTQKIAERQQSFGEAHAQALRLAAHIDGDEAGAADFMSRITWQDMEVRSMSQAVDALGKAVQMVGMPVEAAWERIPGVTKADVDEWKSLPRPAEPPAQPQAG